MSPPKPEPPRVVRRLALGAATLAPWAVLYLLVGWWPDRIMARSERDLARCRAAQAEDPNRRPHACFQIRAGHRWAKHFPWYAERIAALGAEADYHLARWRLRERSIIHPARRAQRKAAARLVALSGTTERRRRTRAALFRLGAWSTLVETRAAVDTDDDRWRTGQAALWRGKPKRAAEILGRAVSDDRPPTLVRGHRPSYAARGALQCLYGSRDAGRRVLERASQLRMYLAHVDDGLADRALASCGGPPSAWRSSYPSPQQIALTPGYPLRFLLGRAVLIPGARDNLLTIAVAWSRPPLAWTVERTADHYFDNLFGHIGAPPSAHPALYLRAADHLEARAGRPFTAREVGRRTPRLKPLLEKPGQTLRRVACGLRLVAAGALADTGRRPAAQKALAGASGCQRWDDLLASADVLRRLGEDGPAEAILAGLAPKSGGAAKIPALLRALYWRIRTLVALRTGGHAAAARYAGRAFAAARSAARDKKTRVGKLALVERSWPLAALTEQYPFPVTEASWLWAAAGHRAWRRGAIDAAAWAAIRARLQREGHDGLRPLLTETLRAGDTITAWAPVHRSVLGAVAYVIGETAGRYERGPWLDFALGSDHAFQRYPLAARLRARAFAARLRGDDAAAARWERRVARLLAPVKGYPERVLARIAGVL